MLARLLRWTYLVQLLVGGLIGSWAAVQMAPRWGAIALILILLIALGWVIFLQAVIIASSMLLSRSPGPLAPWLKAAWGELMAALLVYGLRLPWTRSNPGVLPPTSTAKPGQNALPVLLVHGFVCNHRVWDVVTPQLRAQGHSVLALDLEPLFTSIDDYATSIDSAVTQLCTQTHSEKVILVGHSMGGLAIRAWLRAYGSTRAAKIITLGTPHQGTRAMGEHTQRRANGLGQRLVTRAGTGRNARHPPAHAAGVHEARQHCLPTARATAGRRPGD